MPSYQPKEQRRAVRRAQRRYSDALEQLARGYESISLEHDHGASQPESPHALERHDQPDLDVALTSTTSSQRETPFDTLLAQIAGRMTVALDHLRSTATLIRVKDLGVYSPWASVRAMLESLGIAYFLLDPSIDARTRIARSYNDRLESIFGAHRFARRIDEPVDVASRFEHVIDQAASLGLVVNGTGWKRSVEIARPSMTRLVDELAGDGIYSLCSAYTHAENWAIAATLSIAADTSDPSGQERTLAQAGIGLLEYQAIATLAATDFARVVDRESEYLGWTTRMWNEAKLSSLRMLEKQL